MRRLTMPVAGVPGVGPEKASARASRFRRLAVIGCVVVAATAGAASSASAVVIDSASYGGHTYYQFDPSTWEEAEAQAVALGGHLATIDDEAENTFIANRFGVYSGKSLWIGLTDRAAEGTFVWASGAPLVYTNWYLDAVPPEPNDCNRPAGVCLTEDFVGIYQNYGPGIAGKWNDFPADARLYGIAEVETPVPEPSTLALLGLGAVSLLGRHLRRST